MKIILLIAGLLVLAALANTVAAIDYGPCYAIQDSTARQYCLARKQSNPAPCYGITQNDEQQACLADATGNSAHSDSLFDADTKAIRSAK